MRGPIASLVLVLALFLAPPAFTQKPADLDKVIPSNALVHVTVDGIVPVKTALVEFLNAVMPGTGGMMVEGGLQQLMAQPAMSQVDTAKPLSFTFLPGETSLIALPLKDSAAFEKALKETGDQEVKAFIPGEGASLVVVGHEAKLEDLRKGGAAKPPSLPGTVRGFLNVKGLYTTYHEQIDGALAMFQAMAAQSSPNAPNIGEMYKSFLTDISRIDFALLPSRSGLEINSAISPEASAKGLLAAVAKGQPSPGPNKFIGVIPAGSVLAMTGRISPDFVTGYMALIDSVASGLSPDDKTQLKSLMERALTLTAGDFAAGITTAGGDGSISTLMALTCSDKDKYCALIKEMSAKDSPMQKLMASMLKGVSMSMDYKQAAEVIDGVEVDQIVYHIEEGAVADPAAKMTLELMKKMFAEPVRIAFPAGSVVISYGKGSGEALKGSFASLKSGVASSTAAKALPSGASFAAAVNLIGYLKLVAAMLPPEAAGPLGALSNLPPGKDYVTFSMAPKAGAVEIKVNVPAGAIQAIMMGMHGGAPPEPAPPEQK